MTRRTATSLALTSLNRLRNAAVPLPNQMACLSTAAASSNSNYKSPYADYFNSIQSKNNPSSLIGIGSKKAQEEIQTATLKCGIPEHILKFKTTSYARLMLPPYVQPGEYKVTLQVYARDLPLDTPLEKEIFEQIVGPRFSAEKDELKLSSNHFASRIENKRHLCSMLDRIVIGAKRLAVEVEVAQQSE